MVEHSFFVNKLLSLVRYFYEHPTYASTQHLDSIRAKLFVSFFIIFVTHMFTARVIECMFISAVEYTTKLQRERHTMQEEAEMLRKQIQELNTSIRYVIK